MLPEEAIWIGEKLNELKSNLYPVLNLGSSSALLRKTLQPEMQKYIFDNLEKNGKVYHSDIKDEEGIDLVGDITDPNFLKKIQDLDIKTVICTNLLEHIPDRNKVIDSLQKIIPENGYIIISVPYRYPYHYDPIDTMYRPGLKTLQNDFSNSKMIYGEIVKSSSNYWSRIRKDKRLATILFLRFFLPFYKPKMWWNTVKYYPFIFSNFKITCAVLSKSSKE